MKICLHAVTTVSYTHLGADDDLPGTDCVDCSILWTQMDREKKDGLYF